MTAVPSPQDNELELLRRRVAELEAVNQRQQADLDTLQKSTHRLHTILERSPVVLFETDSESRFTFVEGKGLERLGLTRPQLLGRKGLELFGAVPGVVEHRQQVLAGQPREIWLQLSPEISFRLWSSPLRNEQGDIVGTYGVAVDTTEIDRAEAELQENRAFFEMLAKTSPTGLYLSRSDQCVYANARALEIAGLQPGEISNEAWRSVLHPDDRERVIRDWNEAIQNHRSYRGEYRFLRRDGQVVWVQGEAVPRVDPSGQVIGAVGTITDITAIKQAEESLQSHHEWLTSIAATVPGAIAVYNIRTLRYTFVSQGFQTLLGFDPQLLLAGHFEWIAQHTHPEDLERVMGESAAAVAEDDLKPRDERTNAVKSFEYRMLHADGRWRWVRTIGTVFSRDDQGRIVEVLNVTLDITDRHEMEEQLRRSQLQLEERVRERTTQQAIANESLRQEIAQRRATAAELSERNKLLRSVLEAMSDGVLIFAADGTLDTYNKAAESILSLHMPQNSWSFAGRAFSPDRRIRYRDDELPAARALRGENVHNLELYLAPTVHTHEEVFLCVSAHPLRNDRGTISGAVVVFRNDTARLQALQQLRDSLERFDLMVDGSQVGLWDARINQADPLNLANKLYFSRHMASLLGAKPEEFGDTIGDWARYVHPDDRERVFAALNAHLTANQPYDIEYRCITKSGETRWFAARGGSIRDARNQPVRMSGSFIDITARKQAEAALAEKDVLLRTMMDTTSAVVYIKALDGHYLYLNRQFEELFDVSRSDLIGHTDQDIFPAEVAAAFRRNDQLVAASEGPMTFEEYAPHADGIHTYISVKFALRNLEGHVYATCGISTDITERKLAELRLQEHQRFLQGLLDVNERDRQLLAYDIHDGLVQFITGTLLEFDSLTHALQLSEEQRKRCQRMHEMLRQAINDGRRVLSGLRPLVLDSSGIVVALEYLIAEQRERYPLDVSLTIRVSFQRLAPLLEVTIFRIVQEALNNVNKHSRASHADVLFFEKDGKVRITVRDDGRGFDPLQVSPKRMGLQGIRKRVELLGGEVTLDTAPGKETSLTISLPMTLPEAATPTNIESTPT